MVSITLLAALFKTAFINGWIVRRVLCGYNKPDMVEILRNKSFATRFQILIEIATHGPTIQQRAIAQELSITPAGRFRLYKPAGRRKHDYLFGAFTLPDNPRRGKLGA
ncbi:hypothetical protein [Dehalococcoides mccartyi]|uniref:hypothetical protein n=1 Tax=Dehalococcoides mccartyi TaxID=61435 RepID=UPI0020BEE1AB|nr:hypothetical protein [Dehalococcoides mccartyi]